jgi:TusA-related sulfurtransferase
MAGSRDACESEKCETAIATASGLITVANKKISVGMASLATVVAWLWLYLFFCPRPPGIDRRPHEALGQVLAEEALKQMGPGARLMVIARDPQTYQMPAAVAQYAGFQGALKQAGKSAAVVRLVKMDPLRVVGVAPGEFADLLRQSKEADVIVSFLGPPVLDGEQLAKLGAKRPRVLAVCSGAMPARVNLKTIFDQKLLQAAVVSRLDAPAQPAVGTSRSAFDRQFKLITAANVSDWSENILAYQEGLHE